jgi:hypothetical protein
MVNISQKAAEELAADILNMGVAQKKIVRMFDFVESQISAIVKLEQLGYTMRDIAEIYAAKGIKASLATWKIYTRKAKDAAGIERRRHKVPAEVKTLASLTAEEEQNARELLEAEKKLEELRKNKAKQSVLLKQEGKIRELKQKRDSIDREIQSLRIPGVPAAKKLDIGQLIGRQTELLSDTEVRATAADGRHV